MGLILFHSGLPKKVSSHAQGTMRVNRNPGNPTFGSLLEIVSLEKLFVFFPLVRCRRMHYNASVISIFIIDNNPGRTAGPADRSDACSQE